MPCPPLQRTSSRSGGFTILELSCVLAVIAALTALAVPAFDTLVRRAHVGEARTLVLAIAHAELRHHRDQGRYLACEPQGEIPVRSAPFPNDRPCWQALGIRLGNEVRYRYGVALQGDSFVVTAQGDLDRDGIPSRFTLHGIDLSLQVEAELE